MKCICPDWKENMRGIEASILLLRNGAAWPAKCFRHCPWCGSEFTLEAIDYRIPERPNKNADTFHPDK